MEEDFQKTQHMSPALSGDEDVNGIDYKPVIFIYLFIIMSFFLSLFYPFQFYGLGFFQKKQKKIKLPIVRRSSKVNLIGLLWSPIFFQCFCFLSI